MAKIDPIIAIADKYEPKIRAAFIKAWNEARSRLSLAEIQRALEIGGIEAAMNLLDNINAIIEAETGSLIDSAIIDGGTAASAVIPIQAILNADINFDLFNPMTVDQIRRYKLNLIKDISNNTRDAVRNGLIDDVMKGRNPIDTARDFRNNIGLTAKQEQAVRNYRNSLENLDRDALRRSLRDKRFDSTVNRHITEGKELSKDQINKMVNRYRARYIQYRANAIARTESLRAATIGNRQGVLQMIWNGDIDEESVKRFWMYKHDGKARDAHVAIPGMNPKGVGIQEPYKTPLGPLMYPRDPAGTAANTIQCRCTERFVYSA